MNCLFCDIIQGKREAHFIYEDQNHVAILDKYPIDLGHSLVIPKSHHEKITDMEQSHVGNLFSQIPKIANAILETINAMHLVWVKIMVVLQNKSFHMFTCTSFQDLTIKEPFGQNVKLKMITN